MAAILAAQPQLLLSAVAAHCPALDAASLEALSLSPSENATDASGALAASLRFTGSPAAELRFLLACVDGMDGADGAAAQARFLPAVNAQLSAAGLANASGVAVGAASTEVLYDLAVSAFVDADGATVGAEAIFQRFSDPTMPERVTEYLLYNVPSVSVQLIDLQLPSAPPPAPPSPPP